MKFVSTPEGLSNPSSRIQLNQLFTDERWQTLGDMIPDGLILVDKGGVVRYMNSAAESINEVTRMAVVGLPLTSFVEQARLNYTDLIDTFARSRRVNQVISDADGRRFALSTRCHFQWNGETNCFLILLRNLEILAKIANRGVADRHLADDPGYEGLSPKLDPIMIGEASTMILNRGLRAIAMGSRLLLLGESGVGKTELARHLHRRSGLADKPFVHVNCGSIPESLFESEMFGYERGSFTGASPRGKKGLIEAANGGTLFLDEVGEIPLHCQAKMLQVLEDGLIQRVGATAPQRLRLQVIAATNRDLRELVDQGSFRRDLFYRLSVITLHLPPLRERPELIQPLLDRFLKDANRRRTTALRIEPACLRCLLKYAYPGNVRELQNIIEHLAVVCDHTATVADLPLADLIGNLDRPQLPASPSEPSDLECGDTFPASFDLRDAVRKYESHLIEIAIKRTGSKRKAAELLCVDIATVVRKSKVSDPQSIAS